MSNSRLPKQQHVVSKVYRILSLERKPKLGRTKPSTGPHAPEGRGFDIAGLECREPLEISQ